MKKTIVKQWVKNLRSGEYAQGRETLKDVDGKYCCLGVLADMYSKATKVEWYANSNILRAREYSIEGEAGVLANPILNWAGVKGNETDFLQGLVGDAGLVFINDNGMPFSKIADIIEAQFLTPTN